MFRFYFIISFALLMMPTQFCESKEIEKFRVIGQLKKINGFEIVVFGDSLSEQKLKVVFDKQNKSRGRLMARASLLANSTVEATGYLSLKNKKANSIRIIALDQSVPDPLMPGNGSGIWKIE